VRAIRPGLPLFLYNYSTHQLHGIFEVQINTYSFIFIYYYSSYRSDDTCVLIISASYLPFMYVFNFILKKERNFSSSMARTQAASFGGSNIDPKAWEDKKCPGESRFPAQVGGSTSSLSVMRKEYSVILPQN